MPTLLSLLILILTSASSVSFARTVVKKYDLPPFTGIDASGKIEILVIAGKSQSVALEANQEIFEKLKISVRGKTLYVGQTSDHRWSNKWKSQNTILTVTVPSLESADLSGACRLDARNIKASQFDLEASGAVSVILAGKSSGFSIDVSGAAEVEAFNLKAESVDLDVSGAGDIEIYASKSIEAEASGVAKVRYRGQPKKITRDISGLGSVLPAN